VLGNARVSIRDSLISGNDIGMQPDSDIGPAELNIDNCLVSGNRIGLWATANGTASVARLTGSTVVGSQTGILQDTGSSIFSLGNNLVHGNATDVSGAITPVPPK
jgi:hypothetical protein